MSRKFYLTKNCSFRANIIVIFVPGHQSLISHQIILTVRNFGAAEKISFFLNRNIVKYSGMTPIFSYKLKIHIPRKFYTLHFLRLYLKI